MTKVMITGASGFIGRAVTDVSAAHSDWEVHAVTSGRRKVTFPDGVVIEQCNLLDKASAEELIKKVHPDILLHLAWGLNDRNFLHSEQNLVWMDVSRAILQAFLDNGGTRFLFAGSSAEYGYCQEMCRETGAEQPEDMYGTCKLAFTKLALQQCRERSVQCAVLRYFSVYGKGESHLLHVVPTTISRLLSGESVSCLNPDNVWDYIYITDAAEATVCTARSNICGVVNVASGNPVEMRMVFTGIAEATGRTDLVHILSPQTRRRMLLADTSRLSDELGFLCTTSLTDGLRQTVEWWKDHVN